VWGVEFRVWGVGFRVWGVGFRVWGVGLRDDNACVKSVDSIGCKIRGRKFLGCKTRSAGFAV